MSTHQLPGLHRALLAVSVACAFVLLTGSSAHAIDRQIVDLGGNIRSTVVFNGPSQTPADEWHMPNASFSTGSCMRFDPWFDQWDINPMGTGDGLFTWTGSKLDDDKTDGGPADATFLAGGVITLRGRVFDMYGTELNTGVGEDLLLVAGVSEFRMTETGQTTNLLDLQGKAKLVPSGGWLVTNTVPDMDGGMNLIGNYYLSVSVTNCQNPMAGELVDFGDLITSDAGIQFALNPVPEPTTAMLLAGALMLLAWPGRRR